MTDGERVLLAVLCEPIIPGPDGSTAAPLSPERVAAIWAQVHALPATEEEPDPADRHPSTVA